MLEYILNIFRSKPIKTIYEKRIECLEKMISANVAATSAAPDHLEIHKKEYAQLYEKCKEILKE
jgi:hypothetical protein